MDFAIQSCLDLEREKKQDLGQEGEMEDLIDLKLLRQEFKNAQFDRKDDREEKIGDLLDVWGHAKEKTKMQISQFLLWWEKGLCDNENLCFHLGEKSQNSFGPVPSHCSLCGKIILSKKTGDCSGGYGCLKNPYSFEKTVVRIREANVNIWKIEESAKALVSKVHLVWEIARSGINPRDSIDFEEDVDYDLFGRRASPSTDRKGRRRTKSNCIPQYSFEEYKLMFFKKALELIPPVHMAIDPPEIIGTNWYRTESAVFRNLFLTEKLTRNVTSQLILAGKEVRDHVWLEIDHKGVWKVDRSRLLGQFMTMLREGVWGRMIREAAHNVMRTPVDKVHNDAKKKNCSSNVMEYP